MAAARLSFPCKLYQMLEDADVKGYRHIVAWNAEGTGFFVHDSVGFVAHIIPKYFSNQSKVTTTSFLPQKQPWWLQTMFHNNPLETLTAEKKMRLSKCC